MPIIRFYGPVEDTKRQQLLRNFKKTNKHVTDLQVEKCYHVQNSNYTEFPTEVEKVLRWILKGPQEEDNLSTTSTVVKQSPNEELIEIGPRFNFSTADSTNSVSICQNVGLTFIDRIEVSVRYLLTLGKCISSEEVEQLIETVCDRMTQCRYTETNIPRNDFYESFKQKGENWYVVPVLEKGAAALKEVDKQLGLAFDEWDIQYYTNLFTNVLKRNPTNVELFDCAQCNSEHSRHWFFKGKMIVDGVEEKQSLIDMIIDTQRYTNPNNTVKFSDNSSAIKGYLHKALRATQFDGPGDMELLRITSDLIFTAETHNMPTALSPFSGATTGTGGRIRDVQSIGRGGLPISGTVGYCVGMLNIPGYDLPYEQTLDYPPSFSRPLKILIEASNGCSDYGNKFGEPVVSGFAVSFGVVSDDHQRMEYVKPVLFSGGIGTAESTQMNKLDPKPGMLLAKLGGPVYRIGVGGGAASSVDVQGDNNSDLDFNAVQRGDAEMENKLNRVVRACIELGEKNPILAIHDQGAGGNGNVLKELVEPGCAGAVIFAKEFKLGDPTINLMELWGAEYQENNAILVAAEHRQLLLDICARERCPISFVGVVTGNGYVSLIDHPADFEKYINRENREKWGELPFDMHLDHVLGKMPQKEFKLQRKPLVLRDLDLSNVTITESLNRILSTVTVGSKRFLTNKVDRCVTGLVAQQQCVGPLHTPLADFAITAVSSFGIDGIATSIGTQPIKGLLDNMAGARMSVAEAISNLVFVRITELADIKCSGNWMWAAKLEGEGAKLVDACKAMCAMMKQLNIGIDGGKDSLSMAARVKNETVKSPGTLVISTYAPCPDIRVKVTPDLKAASLGIETTLIYVNIEGKFRLGGSVLAQCYGQLGAESPDLEKPEVLVQAFNTTQKLLKSGYLLSGHDVSDGGLLTCALEMAFAGLAGLKLDLTELYEKFGKRLGTTLEHSAAHILFAEECGWIIEVDSGEVSSISNAYNSSNVPFFIIGKAFKTDIRMADSAVVEISGQQVLKASVLSLFKQWERTSFEIEKLQANEQCAVEEYASLDSRSGPTYNCTVPQGSIYHVNGIKSKPRVAVIREEGTNGDREMAAALFNANFEVHDVSMSDLLNGKTTLDRYRGVIFPGGFSYADTLGSAKGWAACILYSNVLAPQFTRFKSRTDTFSLGVCNGCQLMGLIGWISLQEQTNVVEVPDVALLHNKSERFECRWSTLKIAPSKSIMLRKLEGSVLGCWVAHGEGRFSFKSNKVLAQLKRDNRVAMHYVDDNNKPTEAYPMNPNGSVEGIAAICSADGRHLAMMPHPERCTKMWQWPYISPGLDYMDDSPWHSMFAEANRWCLSE
ncbi:phosphoribosylformylglycinamidine synthase [Toxorhynchites rutilus septentrionalis]|uniref:phosphoribosylformylglycinamidine synthase n=1 Tax=Toxorhynchites rutilus septentrionalis TaxID=329112 RepID=UPI002478C227|nr:phosphoribosylformylglycinamidine synthase [Toxorhynchites rutilus septentrionalis]